MNIKAHDDLLQAEMMVSFRKQKMVVSVYVIDGLLIDTGPPIMRDKLIPCFEEWAVKDVILTHHHEDHTGAAHWIQAHQNIPIYIHESGIENCEKRMKLPFYRKVFWGERQSFQPLALGDQFTTANYTWDIIHTPGHAHDHVALFNREKGWMFGSDLYVHPTPKSFFAFESVPVIIDSLKKLLTYDFDTYVCSHAGVIHKGRQVIEKKLDYLEGVQREVLALATRGKSPHAIRKTLFPKSHPLHYLSLFENSPKHIVNSILR
ncbi:MBL fold metallo-hydrolase [Sporosarcina sp. NPDC096371]|uniref:MBL fold metallo-hydrolase n=1 Tax=Sporosarcina sp. NPDC096371 TaxID=3364530 RepID=UPI0037FF882C